LQHFLNISSCTKQTTQNKVATPTLYSTLAFSSLPLESEQSVSTWIDKGRDEKARVEGGGCNFVLDNCYACCVLFFCLSLPHKVFLSFPYPHKEKKGRTQ